MNLTNLSDLTNLRSEFRETSIVSDLKLPNLENPMDLVSQNSLSKKLCGEASVDFIIPVIDPGCPQWIHILLVTCCSSSGEDYTEWDELLLEVTTPSPPGLDVFGIYCKWLVQYGIFTIFLHHPHPRDYTPTKSYTTSMDVYCKMRNRLWYVKSHVVPIQCVIIWDNDLTNGWQVHRS